MDIHKAAKEFAAEIGGVQELKKKTLFDTPNLQGFLLYIKAQGHVPSHQVKGEITVQTLIGDVRMGVDDSVQQMPVGSLLPVRANARHELWAELESVCLITMVRTH